MNTPFLWHWLRYLAALFLVSFVLAAGDVIIHAMLMSEKFQGLGFFSFAAAIIYLASSWWLVVIAISFLALPIFAFLWKRTSKKNRQSEVAEQEPADDETREESAEKAKTLGYSWAQTNMLWTQTTDNIDSFLWGKPAQKHWLFITFGLIYTITYLLLIQDVGILTATMALLKPEIGQTLFSTGLWLGCYLAYRILARFFPSGRTSPLILIGSAGFVCIFCTQVLHNLNPKYAAPGLPATALLIGLASAPLSKWFDLRRSTTTLFVALFSLLFTWGAYEGGTPSHKAAMTQSTFGLHLMRGGRIFFDPDADNLTSAFPNVDCGGMDELQGYEAIEIIGDGIDNNCIGGDISVDEIAPMRPPQTHLQKVRRDASLSTPPVIIISVDTLRADYIEKEINGHALAPNLRKLFADSVYFTHAYAPSTHTMDSIPSTFSGMYPGTVMQGGDLFLGSDRNFPEILNELGYTTEAITTIPSIHHTLTVGFDRIDNQLGYENRRSHTAPQVYTKSIERLNTLNQGDKPFLLWSHFFDPHGFYIYVQEGNMTPWLLDVENEFLRNYSQEVWRADAFIGLYIKELKRLGLYDKSIIIFFSDHGEALGEEGVTDHCFTAAETILRIPFAIKYPNTTPKRIDTPVSIIDLFPTMIDLLRIQGTEPRPGRSLRPAFEGGKIDPHPIIINANYSYSPTLWALIEWPWKLIFDRKTFTFLLQNIKEDPNAVGDVSSLYPERTEEMKQRLGKWRDRHFHNQFLQQKAFRLEARKARVPKEFLGPVAFPQGFTKNKKEEASEPKASTP